MSAYQIPEVLSALDPDHLQLILFPTEQCNFRCTYCYEAFELGRMGRNVQTGIRRLIQNRTDLRSLQISWFGGEPLVAFDIVRDLSQFFHEECSKRHIAYSSDMTTNGYLIDGEKFEILIRYGVKTLQISLDGAKQGHNQTRIRANGAGSFDRIIANLALMHRTDHDFLVIVRLHYHQKNVDSIYVLIDQLADLLRGDERFRLFFKKVSALGGPNDQEFPFANNPEILEESFRNYARGRVPLFMLAPSHICYACKANSLAIRANGRLAKCTVALQSPANDIGYIKPTGEIVADNQRYQLWVDRLINGSQKDRACPLPSVLREA